MEFALFCTRINVLILLLSLSSPCKFIQSPMDFGPLNFLQETKSASLDFGRIFFSSPSAVLRPQSPKEISQLLSFVASSSPSSSFSKATVAARGAGHSIHGQAQAPNGIVVEMDSLPPSIEIHKKRDGEPGFSYVDVSGGTLWVDLLKESLQVGLTPRSWTDYLYLTIGGTLSNGGISGQTFKYGPQISNVLQLDVVTGKGELVTCSPNQSSELFYAVLGGLGQFGIITSARIILQDAPQKDQELLVSMAEMVDYVEGFMVLNEQSLHSSSTAFPSHLDFIPQLDPSRSDVYYCIEFAVHHHQEKESCVDQVVEEISRKLSFMPTHIYSVEVSYFDFLNRVRMEEISLRRRGMWDVHHPWLNMFVPRSGIKQFRDLLLEKISPSTFVGPILIYPMLRDKWDSNTSAVLPEGGPTSENVIYVVGILQSANPRTCQTQCLQTILAQNRRIVRTATYPPIGAKQYLAHYSEERQWREHFGGKWEGFVGRKFEFDPLGILAPGQGIFARKCCKSPSAQIH
ncbi:cytokinin dehydrogenase 3-like isoform X2 [Magnolia sinica]|uniref:cytokinin dehydrogenase 3-like isoform X2 n=1 Tax=Magnolia sinica TaxID=86752 RepID=UPI0026583430|nr:cytokinin dehydrogenase 3-like isoform X2 [Magnolia sinica]